MGEQRGQTAVEYLGVLLVVAVLVGASIGAAGPVGGAITRRISCAVSVGSCGKPAARPGTERTHAAARGPRRPARRRRVDVRGLALAARERRPATLQAPRYGARPGRGMNEPPRVTAARRRAVEKHLRAIGTAFYDTVQRYVHGGPAALVDAIYRLHLRVSSAIRAARAAGLTRLADTYQGYLDLQLDRVRQEQFSRETPKQQQADIATLVNDVANAAAAADGVRDPDGFEKWSKEHQADVDYAVKRWIDEGKTNATGAKLLMRGVRNPGLRDCIEQLHRPGASIGDGSTIDALLSEAGRGLGRNSPHYLKAIDRRNQIANILKRGEPLSPTEREIAGSLYSRLSQAIARAEH